MGIINAMFKFRFFPDKWKQANIIFISKPGKSQYFPLNHRFISSFLPSVAKIAEILPDEQCGFQPLDQLIRVVQFAAKSTEWKQFTRTVFLKILTVSVVRDLFTSSTLLPLVMVHS